MAASSTNGTAAGHLNGGGSSAGAASGLLAGPRTVCAFWLGPRCYAFDTQIVSEVVAVEALAEVPLAPPSVLGVFSLRGAPLALVDLTRVLELPDAAARRGGFTALVLRTKHGPIAAGLIDRMEAVIPLEQGAYAPREWADEHPAVHGFLDVKARNALVVTVFDSAAVIERLERLRFR